MCLACDGRVQLLKEHESADGRPNPPPQPTDSQSREKKSRHGKGSHTKVAPPAGPSVVVESLLIGCLLCLSGGAPASVAAEQLAASTAAVRILRVASDPNNLPFSNARLEGFENKVAAVLARELNAQLEYDWRPQRRGFFRETLKEGNIDLVLGVPAGFERALTTRPYYRSSYAFVVRRAERWRPQTFEDQELRRVRVGVQLIGDDGANTPPAHALAARGIITNVSGFTVYGDYAEANPPARIVDAVARNQIDVAIAWGPLAGYFASRQRVPLEVIPITASEADVGSVPLTFDIALGVKRRDQRLRDELDAALVRRRAEIERILDQFGVPRVPERMLKTEKGRDEPKP